MFKKLQFITAFKLVDVFDEEIYAMRKFRNTSYFNENKDYVIIQHDRFNDEVEVFVIYEIIE